MEKLQVYKCGKCGNIVEVLHVGGGQLACCGEPMQLQTENTTDAAKEKHVPFIEKTATGIRVQVGSVPHPMEEKHSILWIQAITPDGRAYTQFLKPGEKPEAVFTVDGTGITVREYCNLHGHWKATI